ncbi:unnamed protein product [Phytophthora fragariaefolia]|uniref:Unnamed protein product n=1 Tax=Phytophthora fragariaefolia TaxID=1490495 RepID=A0A9W6Y797_9STRA|nr:unnamed protein product [Phytophthora fragariaefolia]
MRVGCYLRWTPRTRRALTHKTTQSFNSAPRQGSLFTEHDWLEKVLPALKTFRQEFGHSIVDEDFKVPSCPPWPNKIWQLPLGALVCDIRNRKTFGALVEQYKGQLELLRFPWDPQAAVWNERIIPALEAYADEFGHCRVDFMFLVPSRDPWPQSAWGMNLGATVASMRGMGSFFAYIGRDVDRLNKLGYSLELSSRVWKKCVAPLLETYADVFGTRVPNDFVIPSEKPWPEEMWGVCLGVLVAYNARHL